MNELLLIVLAYLIGSIPSSVWVSQHFFDIDIREYGSGNAGATNTYRVLGPKWGSIVMIADMVKGIVAVKLALLLPAYFDNDTQLQTLQIGLGLAAVVGHIFPIWADFRGGKGVATLFGIVLGISPWTALSCVGIFPPRVIPDSICFIELNSCEHCLSRIHFGNLQCRQSYLSCICNCGCVDGFVDPPEEYRPDIERG
jgi:acyl-phosphate glycerol 3-phosphate acyltransferase